MRGKEAHVERCHAGPAVYVRGESPLLYCDAFDYWGKGTLVTVTTETQKAPTSLFGLSPCGSGGDAELLSLGCLASGYFPPGSVTFKWTDAAGNSVSDFLQYPSVKSGSTYSAVSQLQVKAEDWEENYKCSVQHPALSDSMTTTIQPPPEKSCLNVILKNPRAKDLFLEKKAVLECVVTGGNEADVTEAKITWKVNSERKQEKERQQSDPLRKSSFLSIGAKEWESGKSVECSVKQNNGFRLKKTIRAKTGSFPNPVISIFAPQDQDIDKKWLHLVCLVNVSDQSDIYVAWKKGQGSYEEGLTGEPVKTGSINSVTSIFTISKDDWDKGMMFSCAAAHSFLKSDESTISKSTSKSHEKSCLDVILKNPRAKDLFLHKNAVLECVVTGRNETDVTEAKIIWKVNSEIKQEKERQQSDPLRKSSFLSIGAKEWESGKSVECSVQQKNGPLLKKTIKAKTGSFPNPVISIFAPQDQDIDKKWLHLVCLVNVSDQSDIYVAWKKGQGSYEEGLTGEPVKTGSINSVTSIFTISKDDWDKGMMFSCAAAHSFLKSDESTISKSTSKSHEKSCLDVILKNPRAKDLFLHKNAVLECVVTGRNETDVTEAKIIWKVNSEIKQEKERQQSDPLRKSSFLSIGAKEWESGKSVECSVQQKNGPLLKKTIKAKTGNFQNPIISIFAPRNQDIDKNWLQLVCLVNVSDQSDIYVAWKKGQGPYEEGLTGEPVKTGSINSVTSIFTISKDDWNKGMMFSCAAAHSFLKSDESTISKSTSKSDVGQEEKYHELCVSEGILEVNESDSPWYTALSFIILFLFTFVYSAFVSLHQVKQ